ncbi:epoxyqueuosine reductase [Clostridium sp. OS1-26]|uniref:epoxyqueuosine reductase n=1 Tax=Clostridium sp. OS1-26 TaxID=3070681 RepID=UPI0027E0D54E|nr:epoxyqueuosine reductase [Clostridium sp. OS1-26]WML34000.1 epoxyqueuosine reductase [Clostridium sp. OS1-26]
MKKYIEELIKNYVNNYGNIKSVKTKYREPLVAFASADDEEFAKLKHIVSPSHMLPKDFLEDAKTVVCYFIPFDESIVQSNIEGKESSEAWAVAFVETNEMMGNLNNYIKNNLEQNGYHCSAVPLAYNFDRDKLISDWSQRHVAFIAGLGTFGLNNMLITEKGCCGRFASVVTNLSLEPSDKKLKEHCLYKANNTCKKCVKRCVNDALKEDSFDRKKCNEMCLHNDKLYPDVGFSDVCGKCLVGVPCSFISPIKDK